MKRIRSRWLNWLRPRRCGGAVLLALLLSACPGCAEEADNASASSRSRSGSDGRVIEHTMGRTRVPGDVRRVVALEWVYVEDLLALGVEPVGVVDPPGFRKWVAVEPALPGDTASVGGRQEPSIERIARLEPDLIVATRVNHESLYPALSRIAPTLMFDQYRLPEGVTQRQEMRQTLRSLGEAVGRAEQAEAVLRRLDERIARAREQLAELPPTARRFVLAQTFTQQNAPTLRVFTDDALAVQVLQRLGLTNAWDGGGEVYGFATVGLDALAEVEHANVFYVAQADDDVFAEQFREHPVWQRLAFVTEDRLFALGGRTNFFGGPLSMQLLIDQVTDTLVSRHRGAGDPPGSPDTRE